MILSRIFGLGAAPRPFPDKESRPACGICGAFRAWLPLLAFILTTVFIMLAGQTAFDRYRQTIKQNAQGELGGIAALKVQQITNWLGERTGDARALSEDASFRDELERWLRQGGPTGRAKARLTAHLISLQQAYAAYGYTSISLYDEHAVLRLSSSQDEKPLQDAERERLFKSVRSGQIEFSDIHRDNFDPEDHVEIETWVPLTRTTSGKTQLIGAALFRVDPSRFLFPLIQHWPTSSSSAENVLVRRENDEVVFLNELRHEKNTPLVMHLPLSEEGLLAVSAVMGVQGMVEGVDYRGVPVVGVLSKVDGTSWRLVSKIDKAEIYAPIDHLAGWIELLTLIFVGVSAGIIVYWRQTEKRQRRHDIERRALAKHLDYLAKYANDIVLLLDETGRIVDFNERAIETYGYSADELTKLHIDDLRDCESTLPPPERFAAIDRAGGVMTFETTHLRKNGTKFPVEVSVRSLDIGGEKFYQGIHRDITERKKAEEMLRFHSEILNNLSEGVVLVCLENSAIIFANPEFERIFGYAPGELIGRHVSVLNASSERHPEAVAGELNEELARNGTWVGELHNIRKDGTPFWCQATMSVFSHPQFGKVAVSVHEDITERKNWERGTHERRKGMEDLQKLHVAAQTASAIAHELNQPLLAIASYSKAALMMLKSDKPDFSEICSAIEGSERQAHRAGQSIRELFDFLNSSEFPVEEFDLAQEIVVMLNDARTEHGLLYHSSLRVEEKLPPVRANRTHMQKVLFNLLYNGIEAAAYGPGAPPAFITVTVRRAADRGFAQVTMQDNGPGVSEEDVQHLFEPFFTTKGYGFGMGLTISRSLVEMNGGQLWAAPQQGPGAVFHLTVPLADKTGS